MIFTIEKCLFNYKIIKSNEGENLISISGTIKIEIDEESFEWVLQVFNGPWNEVAQAAFISDMKLDKF